MKRRLCVVIPPTDAGMLSMWIRATWPDVTPELLEGPAARIWGIVQMLDRSWGTTALAQDGCYLQPEEQPDLIPIQTVELQRDSKDLPY